VRNERPYKVLLFGQQDFSFKLFFPSKVSASGSCLQTVLVLRGTEPENELEIQRLSAHKSTSQVGPQRAGDVCKGVGNFCFVYSD